MNTITRSLIAVLMTLCVCTCGCQSSQRGPYQPLSEGSRNPLEAQRLTQSAVESMATDHGKAESLLRQALTADLYHGPAHNNLGVLMLQRGNLYEAANVFEWARKLMPGHPDPRMNLALTLERAGRIDDALEAYATALEVYPNHLPTLQALARCQLRHGRNNDETTEYLQEISLRGETAEWRAWAKEQLSE